MDNNNQYYGGGNSAYYQGGNRNYQYGNQQYYQNDVIQDGDGEGESSFNPMEWIILCLHYWYLFVIALAIALGLAMLKNRKWLPSYYSQGTLVIKEGGTYGGSSALMQGFGVEAGYKNVNNQVVMLGSYDLMCRVVDSLPFMNVEYITQGRFKTRNLYRNTPIVVEYTRVALEACDNMLWQVDIMNDDELEISGQQIE